MALSSSITVPYVLSGLTGDGWGSEGCHFAAIVKPSGQ
jgi:hypothetical protein